MTRLPGQRSVAATLVYLTRPTLSGGGEDEKAAVGKRKMQYAIQNKLVRQKYTSSLVN